MGVQGGEQTVGRTNVMPCQVRSLKSVLRLEQYSERNLAVVAAGPVRG